MNTLYKQIPEWENPNNYKEVMIDMNDSNPNTLKVKLEKRFIKIMYKYWSRVRVTSWFYEGMEGTVIRENISMEYPNTVWQSIQTLEVKYPVKKVSYKCLLKNWLDDFESDYIPESSLELIK